MARCCRLSYRSLLVALGAGLGLAAACATPANTLAPLAAGGSAGRSGSPGVSGAGNSVSAGGSGFSGSSGFPGVSGSSGVAGSGDDGGPLDAGDAGDAGGAAGAAGSPEGGAGAPGDAGVSGAGGGTVGGGNCDWTKAECEPSSCAHCGPNPNETWCIAPCQTLVDCVIANPACSTAEDPLCGTRLPPASMPNMCTSAFEMAGGTGLPMGLPAAQALRFETCACSN